ncbi:cold shock domain-containing protein [Candidatus Woesearchaeota archaeon]|jgi:CspA family cold shock protein|nr:cold shock domain-containing protein [Candidatus Woesearchaeota archaeon]
MKGTVKWFNPRKGFGFIKGEDEKEYFVHISQVPQDASLNEDDEVEFEAEETEKGLQAQKVKKVE